MDNFCCSHSAQLIKLNAFIHFLNPHVNHTLTYTHMPTCCAHMYMHTICNVSPFPPPPPPYIGALLAYIALKDVFSPLVYGICFGLISGMMVYIALTELLPTAYKFHNSSEAFIPTFLVTGMLVMAASLLLFTYA